MNTRLVLTVLFVCLTFNLSAEPRAVTGTEPGPVVALLSGAQGTVTLWHEDAVVRGWAFPGPFATAVVLAGPLDRVEWEGDEALVVEAGKDASATAQSLLALADAPRLVFINTDGAARVLRTPDDEKDMEYDAASAATEG